MKNQIRELVAFALSDKLNEHKAEQIGKVTKKQAKVIFETIGIDMYGCPRFIDTSAVRHIIKQHGSAIEEQKRGLLPINIDDIANIAKYIARTKEITYIGKNKLKQDIFQYVAEDNGIVIVMEAVRINKNGNKMYIETMFKKKAKKQPKK